MSLKFRARTLWVLLVAALIFTSVTAQDETEDGQIIFSSGHYEYDIMLLSGDKTLQLTDETNTFYRLRSPRWSPDGNRIAFTDADDVYIMDGNGSNLVQLTQDIGIYDTYIDWSPDGKQLAVIAYQAYPDEIWQIKLLEVETGEITNLTAGEYRDGNFGLTWSPDGQSIVFTSNRDMDGDGISLHEIDVNTGDILPYTVLV